MVTMLTSHSNNKIKLSRKKHFAFSLRLKYERSIHGINGIHCTCSNLAYGTDIFTFTLKFVSVFSGLSNFFSYSELLATTSGQVYRLKARLP